jgi:hypothetical protein
MIISHSILRMRDVADKSCRKNRNILCSKSFAKNCVVYEIMWKNMIQPDGPQINNIIRRMRLACWITNAADTQNILYALFLHDNYGYANGPPCYVTSTLPVLNSMS